MHLPRENHSGVELSAAQKASLRSLEDAGKLRGWIVILSADAKRGVRITDTSGAQFLISRSGQVTTVAT
jgi:hypothetical protein